MPGIRWAWALIVLAALAASAEIWISTRPGAGISPDSIVYMAVGKNMMAGLGITTPSANGHNSPLTHFPPFFPFILGCLAVFFHHYSMIMTARGLNIILFGLNTALIGGWIYRRTKNVLFALFAMVIHASAIDVILVHTMIWSEPSFIFLTFTSLYLLDRYIERRTLSLLVFSGILSAAAALTRYAGVAGIAASVFALMNVQKDSAARRMRDALIFLSISGIPLALWLLRNKLMTHDATTRQFVFHPVLHSIFAALQNTSSLWLSQSTLSPSSALWVDLAILVVGGFAALRYRKPSASMPALSILLIFCASYIALMVAIILFVEAQLLAPQEYARILAPLHYAFLLTFLFALSRCAWPKPHRYVAGIAAMAFCAYYVPLGVANIREFSQEGQQFANAAWRDSPTIAWVRQLPPERHVYTNGRMPIYLYAERSCFEIPAKTQVSTLQANADYQKLMNTIRTEVIKGTAVVVCFDIENLPQFPSPSEWETFLGKAPRKTLDGTIFGS